MTRKYSLVIEGDARWIQRLRSGTPGYLITGRTLDEVTSRANKAIRIYWDTVRVDPPQPRSFARSQPSEVPGGNRRLLFLIPPREVVEADLFKLSLGRIEFRSALERSDQHAEHVRAGALRHEGVETQLARAVRQKRRDTLIDRAQLDIDGSLERRIEQR